MQSAVSFFFHPFRDPKRSIRYIAFLSVGVLVFLTAYFTSIPSYLSPALHWEATTQRPQSGFDVKPEQVEYKISSLSPLLNSSSALR